LQKGTFIFNNLIYYFVEFAKVRYFWICMAFKCQHMYQRNSRNSYGLAWCTSQINR